MTREVNFLIQYNGNGIATGTCVLDGVNKTLTPTSSVATAIINSSQLSNVNDISPGAAVSQTPGSTFVQVDAVQLDSPFQNLIQFIDSDRTTKIVSVQ